MMDDNTRDDLLIRLDEKTASIFRELKEQSSHLGNINGTISKNEKEIANLCITVYGRTSEEGLCDKVRKLRSDMAKLLLVCAVVAGATGSGVAGLIRLFS